MARCVWEESRHRLGSTKKDLAPLLVVSRDDQHLDFRGIHLFAGTQILDDETAARTIRRRDSRLRDELRRTMNAPPRTLDFGGGLGIPYFPGDTELDLSRLREAASTTSMAEIEEEDVFRKPNSWLSLGVSWSAKRASMWLASTTSKSHEGRSI